MKHPAAAVAGAAAGMNWKTALALGAVLLAIVGVFFWTARRAPKAAADAAGEVVDSVTGTVARQFDKLEETVSDPNNRVNRIANALYAPILGTNNITGKQNTIGSAIAEAQIGLGQWWSGL